MQPSTFDFKQAHVRLANRYFELGQTAGENLEHWLSGQVPLVQREAVEAHFEETHLPLLFDAFWQWLPFGTGGRRGRVGYGPNRMNLTTVGMTVQGHCDYLNSRFPSQEVFVVVANDVRVFNDLAETYGFLPSSHPLRGVSSRSFGRLACEIYAGNGIKAYFAEPEDSTAILTTPELSFLIHDLAAQGGINLSASHNPPDDNGLKVYDEWGSQPIAPHDQQLADTMNRVSEVRRLDFEKAFRAGRILPIPADAHQRYTQTYVALYCPQHEPDSDHIITYTPLNGSGWTTVGEVLEQLGFPVQMPPDQGPDGSFSAIPLKAPNPEQPQATVPACAFAEQIGSSLVLSSDPDADRVGAEIRLPDDSWYHFDGNQIAAMLCYHLMLDREGPRKQGLVIETLVTTKILGEIVRRAGNSWIVDDLLVGFKYVADVLKKLDSEGRFGTIECAPEDLVLAAEESHGVMVIPHIRDKDATPACVLLAILHQRMRRSGRTLLDYYTHILDEVGGFDSVSRSIMMPGAEGMRLKDQIMASLRQFPPREVSGSPVLEVVDYFDQQRFGPFLSDTDRMARNVIQIKTRELVVTIRPSGTEPKVKFYCQILPSTTARHEAVGRELLDRIRGFATSVAGGVYNDLLALIGVRLDPEVLQLPDIVNLEQKNLFQETTAPELKSRLNSLQWDQLDPILAWLTEQTAQMTPGSDPLPAIRQTIAAYCRVWSAELAFSPGWKILTSWAESPQTSEK